MRSGNLIRWVFVLALIVIGAVAASVANAQPAPQPVWLVQIGFPSIAKHPDADANAYPGRVEVYAGGRFLGCAWAPYYEPAPGQRRLVPLNVGYTYAGNRDDIHVEAFGELERLGGMTVRITELNGSSAGPSNAR
jgi:hypothetical protein